MDRPCTVTTNTGMVGKPDPLDAPAALEHDVTPGGDLAMRGFGPRFARRKQTAIVFLPQQPLSHAHFQHFPFSVLPRACHLTALALSHCSHSALSPRHVEEKDPKTPALARTGQPRDNLPTAGLIDFGKLVTL